jgi:hypothetical protein
MTKGSWLRHEIDVIYVHSGPWRHHAVGFDRERKMRRPLAVFSMVFPILIHNAQAQPLTVDPESIVPLPDKFDMETPAPDVPPEIARFYGAWIGTWGDDIRTVLVVERVKADGRADVIFAHGDSAWYGIYREWWRGEAKIADGVLTIAGKAMLTEWLRSLQYAFDGPDRLFQASTYHAGVSSPEHWSAPMRHGLPPASDPLNGRGPASACGFRTSWFGHPMARGRLCSKRPIIRALPRWPSRPDPGWRLSPT